MPESSTSRVSTNQGSLQDPLDRNIAKLAELLKLNVTEQAILRVAVITTSSKEFTDLFNLTLVGTDNLIRALRDATGCDLRAINSALAEGGTLRRGCFFENSDISSFGRSNPLEVTDGTVRALLAPRFDEKRFLRHLIRPTPPATLALSDFNYIACLDVAQQYLRQASGRHRRGVNILLYGAPGTGKTEFVRSLAKELALELHEVPNQDSDGDPIGGRRRFGAYSVCQGILAHRRRQLLLFDEVEDVFGGGSSDAWIPAMFMPQRKRAGQEIRKGWINETLESNPVPAIWVCNSIDGIDPAYMRRFDLALQFVSPGPAVRRRMIDRYFTKCEISDRCATRLASLEHLAPANIERAARVAHAIRRCNISSRDRAVERIVLGSLKAMGHRQPIASPILPENYDTSFVNTDRDLAAIVEGLRRRPHARICLYGPPGTGKTAFAHHMGKQLGFPVSVKRGSDLISPYVGRTEANIANAFERALNEGAILLIDEADGFLATASTRIPGRQPGSMRC